MTLILGIDTATSGCAVALLQDGHCLAERAERMTRGQSEALAPMIEQVISHAGITPDAIDAIAVTRGPGAFTGLRIGLATARALALTLDIPCLGIGTFDVLAAQAREHVLADTADALLIVIESKRAEMFCCAYEMNGSVIDEPMALLPDQFSALLGARSRIAIAGDGADKACAALQNSFETRCIDDVVVADAKVVARLAQRFIANPSDAPASPLYLRPPDVTLKA